METASLSCAGMHETLEAVKTDETSELYRAEDSAVLPAVKAILEEAIRQGLRYGAAMRVTLVQNC